MRIEERKNRTYHKKPDQIDSYVLNIINRFFETDPESIEGTREAIIEEAVKRIKVEFMSVIKKIIVDETRKFTEEELDKALDLKLADIIKKLESQLDEIKKEIIRKDSVTIKITEQMAYMIDIPKEKKFHSTKDRIDIFVNGILCDSYVSEVDSNGFLTKVGFNPDVLLYNDVVVIKAIQLH